MAARSRVRAAAGSPVKVNGATRWAGSSACDDTQFGDAGHHVEPIRFTGPPAVTFERLRSTLQSMPGARVITADDGYLHAEFTSRLFRFVDDVECLVDPAGQVIHVRSASRVGHSDFGVNRRRVEALRAAFGPP